MLRQHRMLFDRRRLKILQSLVLSHAAGIQPFLPGVFRVGRSVFLGEGLRIDIILGFRIAVAAYTVDVFDSTRATGWFYSVFFTSRCDKPFQMKEISRISADIVIQRCLKVVPVVVPKLSHKDEKKGVVPIKVIWLGQVESEHNKKKNPGKPHGSGVLGHSEVSINAWRTAAHDGRL